MTQNLTGITFHQSQVIQNHCRMAPKSTCLTQIPNRKSLIWFEIPQTQTRLPLACLLLIQRVASRSQAAVCLRRNLFSLLAHNLLSFSQSATGRDPRKNDLFHHRFGCTKKTATLAKTEFVLLVTVQLVNYSFQILKRIGVPT